MKCKISMAWTRDWGLPCSDLNTDPIREIPSPSGLGDFCARQLIDQARKRDRLRLSQWFSVLRTALLCRSEVQTRAV
jgi:hypothetical protein